MNGLAILSVILFHAAGWGYTALFAWTPRYLPVEVPNFDQVGTLPYYLFRFVDQLAVFSIPAFLFVSGAFVAFSQSALQRKGGMRKLWNRIRVLIIPYLAWSAVMIFLRSVDGDPPGLVEIGRMLMLGSSTAAYYYVPLLVQLILVAPIIFYLAEARPLMLIAIAGTVTLMVNLLPYSLALMGENTIVEGVSMLLPKWFFLTRLFWFACGMIFARHISTWRTFMQRWKGVLLAITVISFAVGIIEWELLLRYSPQPWIDHRETLIDTLYSAGVIASLLAFTEVKLPGTSFLNTVGSQSYGIYLAHIPIMEVIARGLYHSFPSVLGWTILFASILTLLGLGLPVIMMNLLRRSSLVRVYPLVFG